MRERVEQRAGHRCEYCRAPQEICAYTFHIDHIVPRSKGGVNSLSNYALACFPCNNAKSAHNTGLDPEGGNEVPLFHPRKQKWEEHFAWSRDFSTVRGQATVERLKMNARRQVEARPLWVETGTCRESRAAFFLSPEISIERAVLDRLADVRGGDFFFAREIGDRAGDFQDAIVSAGAEV